jgi:hypothetical protein
VVPGLIEEGPIRAKRPLPGEWEGRFSKEEEFMSPVFKKEVDSVLSVYLRYTNN